MSGKFIVVSDSVGTRGEERLIQKGGSVVMEAETRYYNKGAKVTADEVGGVERAERLVERGHLKAEADVEAEKQAEAEIAAAAAKAHAAKEKARQDRLSAENAAAGGPAPEKLTEKQALQKEAGELGLDTEGTSADLKARIAEHKANQES